MHISHCTLLAELQTLQEQLEGRGGCGIWTRDLLGMNYIISNRCWGYYAQCTKELVTLTHCFKSSIGSQDNIALKTVLSSKINLMPKHKTFGQFIFGQLAYVRQNKDPTQMQDIFYRPR